MTWAAALDTVRALARLLVPEQEVGDLVGQVMFELVRRCRAEHAEGEGADGIRSLSGLGRSICHKRALDVFRDLRRRAIFVPLDQADEVAIDESVEGEASERVATKGAGDRRFRGPHQKRVDAVLRSGGTLAAAQAATGLCNAEFAKVVRRMVVSDDE